MLSAGADASRSVIVPGDGRAARVVIGTHRNCIARLAASGAAWPWWKERRYPSALARSCRGAARSAQLSTVRADAPSCALRPCPCSILWLCGWVP